MHTLYKIVAIAAVALTVAGSAFAASGGSGSAHSDEAVDKFLVISGLKASLDNLPAEFAGSLFGNIPASIPESAKKALLQGYSEAYPNGSITAAVAAALGSGRIRASIPRLTEIVSAPISLKMTALEQKPPVPADIQKFAEAMKMKPPGEARMKLIKELLDETHSIDVATKIAEVTAESLALAASSGCADDMKKIRDELDKRRPLVREAAYRNLMFGMAYTYRSASDSDLRDYIKTYQDPDARAMHITLSKVTVGEYLSRWKKFEKTLMPLGGELSGRSMFAKNCRTNELAKSTATERTVTKRKRSSLSGKDARECLKFSDNAKIAACAEKYR